jgi:hypothetical protein
LARFDHHFGLAEAVELARVLDRLPPRLWIYGIEGRQSEQGSCTLSGRSVPVASKPLGWRGSTRQIGQAALLGGQIATDINE